MKMRKLLATGVAATVAVTSLATVASAAEKSWSMGQTFGTINLSAAGALELGAEYSLSQEDIDGGATLGISNADKLILQVKTVDAEKVTAVTLKVTGVKGTRNSASQTYEYAFTNYMDAAGATKANTAGDGAYWGLDAYVGSAPVGGFLPEQFVEVTKVEITAVGTCTVDTAQEYDAYGVTAWGNYAEPTFQQDWESDGTFAGTWFNEGGLLDEINAAAQGAWGFGYAGSKSTGDVYPYIDSEYTIIDGARVITRQDVQLLSYSGPMFSDTINGGFDSDQSYEGDDTTAGTDPEDFAGLASQVAEFFNGATNGKITFKFTTTSGSAAGTDWNNGGIPSTQTGIKNFLGGASANDFALFINYAQTGSLQATTTIDAEAGAVEFDITAILEKLGYQTLGTVDNIYFGLADGLDYGDGVHTDGLFVEEVILSYDEDADASEDIEDEDDADDAEVEDDVEEDDVDEDDDVEIDVEDDAAEEDDAEEDDASDVEGDVVTETEDDDANPATGVALAVVPALVAAAAVVVSKKRS